MLPPGRPTEPEESALPSRGCTHASPAARRLPSSSCLPLPLPKPAPLLVPAGGRRLARDFPGQVWRLVPLTSRLAPGEAAATPAEGDAWAALEAGLGEAPGEADGAPSSSRCADDR